MEIRCILDICRMICNGNIGKVQQARHPHPKYAAFCLGTGRVLTMDVKRWVVAGMVGKSAYK